MTYTFLPALISMGVIGCLLGFILAYASRVFYVEVDPKIEIIQDLLPGVDCGACGFPGCVGYAAALVKGTAKPGDCSPGGLKVADKISAILGIEVSLKEPSIAIVRCQGGKSIATELFIYDGLQDCAAAELLAGGPKACRYGCLGFGNCTTVCPFDAIHMNNERLPVVDPKKCTACGLCVSACPRKIIEVVPRSWKVHVACVSHDKGGRVKKICTLGCTGCKICVKETPSGAMDVKDFLAVIKRDVDETFETAIEKCPQKTIVRLNF
ncbi:MAG: hypothetical protein A2161_08980 [Candidatus Schekmanbacteria bacterium RBG_13_48_7]|uniref:Ion-translocating oxidoreductase complex subunit B n=1 Tax=Candidatus Schekmanbacteria bacterium RBG_13_48_7 TaxID=1817878 RepID=A0A1F7RQ82_9BACT|nr:MAG: hypothetical protein A2161_08980 [Candidatus Schekmanbacteria bacterium RBG_13_48_7]